MPNNNLDSNNIDRLFQTLVNAESAITNANDNARAISRITEDLKSSFRDFSISDLKTFVNEFENSLGNLRDVINNYTDQYLAIQDNISDLENKIELLNTNIATASKDDKEYLEQRREEYQRQLQDAKELAEAIRNNTEEQHKLDIELRERHRRQLEEHYTKIVGYAESGTKKLLTSITNLVQKSINSVAQAYEQSAGKLSAALNTSVNDINKFQHKIANELRSTSLSKAISNIEVLNEATSLAAAGYTNQAKLQESATAIAIGKEIAPGVNLESATVKNLTNVFGSDFINKFSSIQAAVQDAAGSAININANLTQLTQDLEPVFLNAEYSNRALQDTSDIQATLSAAQDAGLISATQSKEYLNMIAELMDPSKAYKSKSVAVRTAAATYDFGSGSPMEALQALLSARESMYGGIDMSSSYSGNVSRSLAAAAFGDETMSATYMPSGLYGLDIVRTEDLENVYQEQLGKVQSGAYDTQREKEKNWLENSPLIQGIADWSKKSPITFDAFSASLFALINSLPSRIATAFKGSNLFKSLINGTTGTAGAGGVGSVLQQATGTAGAGRVGGGIGSIFSGLMGGQSRGISRLGSAFSIGLGVAGIGSLIGQWDTDRNALQNFGYGGNRLGAALGYGATGAAIGNVFGPLGAAIGAVVGGLGGLVVSSIALKQKQEENAKAIQAQTQATKDLLGQNVTAIDAIEAKREVARGGGVVELKSGTYAIDYKKSSYAGFASGLDYVPYDDFVARLHKGESVVSASSAEKLRKQNPNFWNSSLTMNEDSQIVNALNKQTDSIVNAVKGDKEYSPLTNIGGPKQYRITNSYA